MQACLICTEFAHGEDFFMERFAPQRNESGWFLGCMNEQHDHNDPNVLKLVSLYELIVRLNKKALPYFALPVGAQIIVEGANATFLSNGVKLLPLTGSLLDDLR